MDDLMESPASDGAGDELLQSLIGAARAGSEEARGQLCEACRAYLMVVANQELPADFQGKIAPSDLVQDTFLEAHRDFSQFAGCTHQEFLGWLRKSLLHNVADACRRYGRSAKRQASREVPLHRIGAESPLGFEQESRTISPSRLAAAHEEETELKRAMMVLPTHYREVIALHNREGLSFAEISRRRGCSAGAVRKTWLRAVRSLQKQLGDLDAS